MTHRINSWLHFLPVATLLVGTAIFLHAQNREEVVPPRTGLSLFPMQLGNWTGRNETIPTDILEALGPGEFLARDYQRRPNDPPVNLFLAYFPSQRAGDSIHSPKNCLPGSGWVPVQSSRMLLMMREGREIPINRYVVARGTNRLLVLYWYQAHGRAVANEYAAKFFLMADAVRLHRTDGALVRVITPLTAGEGEQAAQERVTDFAREILPLLDRHIPR
jgi:EpsI family protein